MAGKRCLSTEKNIHFLHDQMLPYHANALTIGGVILKAEHSRAKPTILLEEDLWFVKERRRTGRWSCHTFSHR